MQIILYGLYVFLLIYLVSFGVNNIKKNFYEIGIISALGSKTKDIGIIFSLIAFSSSLEIHILEKSWIL